MMRSPHFIAVAVRKPNQRIVVRYSSYYGLARKFPFLKKPVLRGVVMLFESMIQGVDTLSYSAQIASEEECSGEQLSNWAIAGSLLSAFVLSMGLFVALPHFVTVILTSPEAVHRFLGINIAVQSPIFHLIDGLLRAIVFMLYVYLIALMKDIHRIFQYHGAEHKSIYAFEAGDELTVENAKKYITLHPRCGTSFLLFLVLMSIGVFSVAIPLIGFGMSSVHPIVNHLKLILLKIFLMLPIAGLAYELIKICACRMQNSFFRLLIWPGMVLQRLTTREPTDDQLEVALIALKQVLQLEKAQVLQLEKAQVLQLEKAQVLQLEKAQVLHLEDSKVQLGYASKPDHRNHHKTNKTEIEICGLAEMGEVRVPIGEFLEI